MLRILVVVAACAIGLALGYDLADVHDDFPATGHNLESTGLETPHRPMEQVWNRPLRSASYQDMMSRSLRSYDDMFSRSLRSEIPYNEMMSRSLRSKALADMMSRTLRSRSFNDMMSRTLRSGYNDMLSRSLRSMPYSDMMSRSLRSIHEAEPVMKKDN